MPARVPVLASSGDFRRPPGYLLPRCSAMTSFGHKCLSSLATPPKAQSRIDRRVEVTLADTFQTARHTGSDRFGGSASLTVALSWPGRFGAWWRTSAVVDPAGYLSLRWLRWVEEEAADVAWLRGV